MRIYYSKRLYRVDGRNQNDNTSFTQPVSGSLISLGLIPKWQLKWKVALGYKGDIHVGRVSSMTSRNIMRPYV
jgi:hypothetical protein